MTSMPRDVRDAFRHAMIILRGLLAEQPDKNHAKTRRLLMQMWGELCEVAKAYAMAESDRLMRIDERNDD